jgi:hypothetical protein
MLGQSSDFGAAVPWPEDYSWQPAHLSNIQYNLHQHECELALSYLWHLLWRKLITLVKRGVAVRYVTHELAAEME